MPISSTYKRSLTLRCGGWLGAFVLFTAYASLFAEASIDDAMISLTYARTLAQGGGLGLFPGVPYYGFTSPLNVFFLAGVGLVAGFDRAITLATGLELTILLALSRQLSRTLFARSLPGIALFCLVALNPLFQSTFGMESLLGATLVIGTLSASMQRKFTSAGIFLGLLILTRPDFAIITLGTALMFGPSSRSIDGSAVPSSPETQRSGWLRLALGSVPIVALWHGYSWVALGSAVPITLLVKKAQVSWGAMTFLNGPALYLRRYPLETLLSVWWIGALVVLLVPTIAGRHRSVGGRIAALALAHYMAFSLLVVPPYHWYYAPTLSLLLVAVWVAVFGWLAERPRVWSTVAVGIVTSLCLASWASIASILGWVPNEVPIHTNWATHNKYRQMAASMNGLLPAGTPVALEGELGTLQYYSTAQLVDALSHPSWAAARLRDGASANGSARALEKLNFTFFEAPVGDEPRLCLSGRSSSRPSGEQVLAEWVTSTRWSDDHRWRLQRCQGRALDP